ncbi:MAG: hypothetical protein ETSY1_33915 [Candidatus Entotheonella factor]|uniref:Uncharacterized protein n=1 Tax=Entotheonella factor TaxID=1429438 RepID=W4L9D5_ENTF1|nr:MAG: hypothetical protein ETSY1_33915 [Candidatus Entotheonella factor]
MRVRENNIIKAMRDAIVERSIDRNWGVEKTGYTLIPFLNKSFEIMGL